jgi:hypothetical protein
LFDDATPNANYLFQQLGLTKSAVFNGTVNDIKLHPFTGKIWIGGNFTSISGVTYNGIVTYDIVFKTFSPVLSGVVNGVNGGVACIEIAPDGNVWVGGGFSSAGGVANTAAVAYYNGTTFVGWAANLTGNSGQGRTVNAIAIRSVVQTAGLPVGVIPYFVIIGGNFQGFGTNPVLLHNIAALSRSVVGTWTHIEPTSGTSAGFNSDVTDIVYNNITDQFFVTGDFTANANSTYDVQGVAVINAISSNYARLLPIGTGARSFLYVDNDGTLLIGLPSQLQSQLYVNGALRPFPYNVIAKPTALRNGIFGIVAYGLPTGPSQYQVISSITYWNGTLLSGTGVVALPSPGFFALPEPAASLVPFLLELPDGTIFFTNFDSTILVSQMSKGYNSSTVASKPTFLHYFGTNANVTHHINMVNQKMLIFQKRLDLTGVFRIYEVFTVDSKSVTCESTVDGNKVWVVNDASQLTTFTIEPGSVILDTNDLSQTLTSSANNPINLSVCYWPQTFQSIFDGVSRS